jgi:hypothetical protein
MLIGKLVVFDKESWKAYCLREDIGKYDKDIKRSFYGSLGYHLFKVNFYASKLVIAIKKELL